MNLYASALTTGASQPETEGDDEVEKTLAFIVQNLDVIVIAGIVILAWLWERRYI